MTDAQGQQQIPGTTLRPNMWLKGPASSEKLRGKGTTGWSHAFSFSLSLSLSLFPSSSFDLLRWHTHMSHASLRRRETNRRVPLKDAFFSSRIKRSQAWSRNSERRLCWRRPGFSHACSAAARKRAAPKASGPVGTS